MTLLSLLAGRWWSLRRDPTSPIQRERALLDEVERLEHEVDDLTLRLGDARTDAEALAAQVEELAIELDQAQDGACRRYGGRW